MTTPQDRQPVEMVTLTEIARRVVAKGWAPTMSRQRIAELADTDPDWPIPRREWRKVGRYWQIPWDHRLQAYFAQRAQDTTKGPKGWATRRAALERQQEAGR